MSDISARFEIFHFHGNHCSCALISKQEVERFPEIELKEIQELKQNAEKRKKAVLGGTGTLPVQAR